MKKLSIFSALLIGGAIGANSAKASLNIHSNLQYYYVEFNSGEGVFL